MAGMFRWASRQRSGRVGVGLLAGVALVATACEPVVDEGEQATIVPPTAAVAGQPEPATQPVTADGLVFFDSDATGTFEIYVLHPDGSVEQLTDDDVWDSWWVRPSPDRTELLFYRTPAGTHDRDFGVTALWMSASDGSDIRPVIEPGMHGWEQHGHAEWSPDGARLAMFAGSRINPQIWVTDRDGGNPHQVTDDPGTNVDPSWFPSGDRIVYVGCPERICYPPQQEIYAVPADGGSRVRLTDDELRDHDPYVSPDGSYVALLTQTTEQTDGFQFGTWDIRRVGPDGGEVTAITSGGHVFSLPRFAPDGTIVTHRLEYGSNRAFDLVRVEPTTGVVTDMLATAASEEYPSP